MTNDTCPKCSTELKEKFKFCPTCGYDLLKTIDCEECGYQNESNSKFCQECGAPLRNSSDREKQTTTNEVVTKNKVVETEPLPDNGITIEFSYSSSQSFDFAVESAKKFPTFRQFGEGKKAIYRISFDPSKMDSAIELIEHLKGWRKRTVYVDGQKVPWDSVFAFSWCYERKKASFKPELYCFGYENNYEFNVWGCIQARLPFTENAEWFTWGQWLSNKGDWKFDKERIKHELQKTLYPYRFCPALQPTLIQEVLNALPNEVNPNKDKNWKFVESWGTESPAGLVATVNRFGFEEKVVMKGVSPTGEGLKIILEQISKRVKFRLPTGD